jgi:hypothetical protein
MEERKEGKRVRKGEGEGGGGKMERKEMEKNERGMIYSMCQYTSAH